MSKADGIGELSNVLSTLLEKNTVALPSLEKDATIKKVTLRTMKPVTDFISEVVAGLNVGADAALGVDLKDPATILKLISKNFDQAMSTAVLLTDLDEDELLDLPMNESVLVIQAIVALNVDFFTNQVLPSLQVLWADLATQEG